MLNIFDIGIVLLLIMFFIIGAKRGVIKETVSLVGIIIVFILSFSLKGIIGNFLCTFLPFFKFTGSIKGLVTINIFLYQTIAFIIVFSILLIIYELSIKISKFIQKIVNMTIILIIPSKILGGLVSLITGYLMIFIVVLLLMIPFGNVRMFRDSFVVKTMLYSSPFLSTYTDSFTKPFEEVYDLGYKVNKKKITVNEANLKSLDIMLEYNVVSKDTIKTLDSLHKLDDIKHLETVLDKY